MRESYRILAERSQPNGGDIAADLEGQRPARVSGALRGPGRDSVVPGRSGGTYVFDARMTGTAAQGEFKHTYWFSIGDTGGTCCACAPVCGCGICD